MSNVSLDQAYRQMTDHLRGKVPSALIASLLVPARAELVRDAREIVRLVLRMLSAEPDACYFAQLVVSELVTNVVRHSVVDPNPHVGIALSRRGSTLRIVIHDSDPFTGEPALPDEDCESGRGLLVVDAVSDRWGVSGTAVGKLTWCELTAWPDETAADRS